MTFNISVARKRTLSAWGRRSAALLLAAGITTGCAAPASAGMWYTEDSVPASAPAAVVPAAADLGLDCKAAILLEPETGTAIYEMNADERMPEASITKVMTMLLVFEALDGGRITMDDMVTCSAYAASMGGSQIWLEEGEQMTVHDLIKAAMVGSANDASVALAEYVAGSHEAFVAMMNERAAQLGMDGTAYKNCTGLDAEGHLTTARDVAIVSAELLRHDGVLEFSTTWMDSMRNGELELVNTNKLVHGYEGCTGLKTGTTSQAGCCVAASATRDGMSLIAVVMGAPNSKTRFACARSLLDHGFAGWEIMRPQESGITVAPVAVENGMEKTVGVCIDMPPCVLIPKGRAADVQTAVKTEESLVAPVEYGQNAGTVTVTLDGAELCRCDILTASNVDQITFGGVFSTLFHTLTRCGEGE